MKLGSMIRRLGVIGVFATLMISATTPPAHAAFGPVYHGDDYAEVTDYNGFNKTLWVCNLEYDLNSVFAEYYTYADGYRVVAANFDGTCTVKGHSSAIYKIRVCEDGVGCSPWLTFV